MRNTSLMRRFWLNAGLSLSVAGMPWTTTIGVFGSTTIATLTSTASVQAAVLSSWEFDPSTQELAIVVPNGTTPRYFLAAEPARIVLDLPNTDVGTVPLEQSYGGAIQSIRVAQFEPGVTRIVLELAPGTVLAPGHVDLQQVETGTAQGDRWVLRPLLATDVPVASSTVPENPPATTEATETEATETEATETGATETTPNPFPIPGNSVPAPIPNQTAPAETVETVEPPEPVDSVTADLPPLEPGAMEIPVEQPSQPTVTVPAPDTIAQSTSDDVTVPAPDTIAQSTSDDDSNLVRFPGPDLPTEPETTSPSEPDRALEQPQQSPEQPSVRSTTTGAPEIAVPEIASSAQTEPLPDALPTDQPFPSSSAATVSVPPLDSSPAANTPDDASGNATNDAPDDVINDAAAVEPPATPIEPTPNVVEDRSVPDALPVTPPTVTTPPVPPATGSAIEFGQPLPKSADNSLPSPLPDGTSPHITHPPSSAHAAASNSAYPNSNVLLPSGTVLNVRYTGEEPLELAEGESRQEVLVLAEAVRDETGNVVFPEGSFVIGRFEKMDDNNQFIAQAVSLQGQRVLVNAQSEGGGHGANDHLLRNSALGVAAGVVLGVTGVGLIPAIAAGAATTAGMTFLPGLPGSRSSDTIQPDQVLEVRLTQDLVRAN